VLQQNPPVLNWRCLLAQVDLLFVMAVKWLYVVPPFLATLVTDAVLI